MPRPYVDPVPALKEQLAKEIVARAEGPRGLVLSAFAIIGGPRLSNLRLSRLDRFSLQGLIRMLARLGYEVTITTITPEEVRRQRIAAEVDARRASWEARRGSPGGGSDV